MAFFVTVPGGSGVQIAIPFSDDGSLNFTEEILSSLGEAESSVQTVRSSSDPNAPAILGDVNELIADTLGTVQVPTGYQYLVDDFDYTLQTVNGQTAQVPANAFIAAGTLDASSIDSGPTLLQFRAGSGRMTVVAGNSIDFSTLAAGAGGGVLDLDGLQTQQVDLTSGSWSVTTGTGAATVMLGTGNDTVLALGPTTISGGSGLIDIDLIGGRDIVDSGSGQAVITAGGSDDTIFGGSGRETVFGSSTGNVIMGGGAEILFVDVAGGNTLTGNTSGLVVFGADGAGSVYHAPASYFLFVGGGGSDTIDAGAGSFGPVVFGASGGRTVVNAEVPGTFVAGGAGPETIDASASTQGIVFFGGTGSTDMIGASNSVNFYGAGSGNSTMSGGFGNLYEFTRNAAGGVNVITDFTPADYLYIDGYGTQSGIATELVLNGTLHMTLLDGTLIIFNNISNPDQLNGHIFHSG